MITETLQASIDFSPEDYLELIILTTYQSRSPETNLQLASNLPSRTASS